MHTQERDRTLQFMNSLLKHKKNVKLLLDAGGIKILIDLVSLAHLHTSRATTPFQVSTFTMAKVTSSHSN